MRPQILPIFTAILTVTSLLMTFIALPANAQKKQTPNTQPVPALREPALNQLATPIALYPDALLAQILMASTYPLDVAEAARWAASYPTATPAAIAAQRWESSVKALLPFAPILAMMSKEKSWAAQLAAAVIKQPAALLDTIQALRERAYDNGALHPARQQLVQRQGRTILIEPAEKRTVYVPYYDPSKVYQAAGNSLLPPEYWAAQPYAPPQNKVDGIVFSTGVSIQDRAFYNAHIDWRMGQLLARHTNISDNAASTGASEWRHNPQYRARKQAQTSPDTVGTDSPPPAGTSVGTSVGTRGASAPPPAPGEISTRRIRTGVQ